MLCLLVGRHLFAKGWETNWEALRLYLDKHPAAISYLTDGGGDTAPKEFLGAVENGIRNTAKGSYKAMGKLALHSPTNWKDKELTWRKRESYITACRKILQSESLQRWDKESQENRGYRTRADDGKR